MKAERSSLASEAAALDSSDPLRSFRDAFLIPAHGAEEQAYFCGNSLGLQPRAVRAALLDELDDWGSMGVEAHFRGKHPWMPYHEFVRDGLAHVVGAEPIEVVAMNSLTVNLHLLMASFYRPVPHRAAILIEAGAFPSDRHAVASQIAWHGFDATRELIELAPDSSGLLDEESILKAMHAARDRIALVLLPGVQYLSGQAFDLGAIARAARAHGMHVGFDLAHAAGNIPLRMHESACDFAVWCSYKYLNSGPGAVAGAFVHTRHAHAELPRLAGWWGHNPATRFRMGPEFVPTPGADGWQLSNPPILALAPLRVSLDIFRQAGIATLRAKSEAMTGWLASRLAERLSDAIEVRTPLEAARRGCQLSLRVIGAREDGRALFDHLNADGVVVDWREPDIIRVAPVPLYNCYADCARLVSSMEAWRDAKPF